nr:hypothetical protein 48 [Pelagibacteraceae bacterium]
MAYSNLDDFDYKPDLYQNRKRLASEIQERFKEIKDERVEHPSHYTRGRVEVIDVIEDVVQDAPSNTAAVLQAQVIKYILRLWLKDSPHEDACKARWYLNRLIDKLTIDTDW